MAKPQKEQATDDLAIVENRINELRKEIQTLRKLSAKIRSSRISLNESDLSNSRKNLKNDKTPASEISRRYEA